MTRYSVPSNLHLLTKPHIILNPSLVLNTIIRLDRPSLELLYRIPPNALSASSVREMTILSNRTVSPKANEYPEYRKGPPSHGKRYRRGGCRGYVNGL